MPVFLKALKALGIILGVLTIFIVVSAFSGRESLFYWTILSSLLLPVTFCLRLGFKKWCASFLVIALGLAVSPIDIQVTRLQRPGVRLLPVSYGIGCEPGTACHGCIIPRNPPRKAVVISY